jgi:hypothetical protein
VESCANIGYTLEARAGYNRRNTRSEEIKDKLVKLWRTCPVCGIEFVIKDGKEAAS